MLAKRTYVIAVVAALGATLAAPLAIAENLRPELQAARSEIANRLEIFESGAAALQSQTDHYASSVRANKPQWESHVRQLNLAKEQANSLGQALSELEELSAQGTGLQQRAVEEARPRLQAVADYVQIAIVMLNENPQSHRTPEFHETVNGIYEHAEDLYTRVDAITDYEKAHERAASMDAPSKL